MVDYATLQVHKETKELLARIRRGGESYDALIRRLLDEAWKRQEEEFLADLDAMYQDEDAFAPLD